MNVLSALPPPAGGRGPARPAQRRTAPDRVLQAVRGALASLLLALAPMPVQAQDEARWNAPRVLDLVERAREERRSAVVDSTLRSYRAAARGHLYFFMDRTGSDERSLVKADQIALDVLWEAPDRTRQHIVGLRDRKLLPTTIRYHLDHLTVVQDDFGDRIRMGDGDEVAAVIHPAAPDAEAVYDYLLGDSLTIRFPDGAPEVRVFEVRVRPRDLERPGFIGSMFLDERSGAIVRMSFSFTPRSYVDPYLDYIHVSLDNSLWMGRHWLPYRQEIEIRREIPVLDVRAGSVIRGSFQIRDYEFNVDFPPLTFAGRPVTSESLRQREAFPFEEDLLAGVELEELAPTPSLEEVRTQVRQVVQDRYLTGLSPLRVHFSTFSDAFRHNRAEGLFLGGGLTLRPWPSLRLRGSVGWSFGRDEPSAALSAESALGGSWTPSLGLHWNELRDVGGHPGAPVLENTIASLSGRKDYLDPYFARGASLSLRRDGGSGPSLTFRWERHEEAADVVSDDLEDTDYRPVRGIDLGTLTTLALRLPARLPARGRSTLTLEAGRMASRTWTGMDGSARWGFSLPPLPLEGGRGQISAHAGWVSNQAPAQRLHLLGGRTTLPGHPYRAFVGDVYGLLQAEATLPVRPPWVGVRLLGSAGWTHLSERALPDRWTATDSDGLRGSVGAGLSLFFDVMRFDVSHGIRGGGWEAVFSVAPNLRAWL